MKTVERPTVGQRAERVLASFAHLHCCRGGDCVGDDEASLVATRQLVSESLAVLETMPTQARKEFAATLPFSTLEMSLLRRYDWANDCEVLPRIARRVHEWVTRSPVFIDEANVHCTDFLVRLEPMLDLWEQREQVDELIGALQLALEWRT